MFSWDSLGATGVGRGLWGLGGNDLAIFFYLYSSKISFTIYSVSTFRILGIRGVVNFRFRFRFRFLFLCFVFFFENTPAAAVTEKSKDMLRVCLTHHTKFSCGERIS